MWKAYLNTLYLSFYSKPLYRHVAREWEGFPFSYLLLLALIAIVPTTFLTTAALSRYLDSDGAYIIEQIPTIQITQGKVSIDAPQPYFIYSPENEVVAVLDTTGKHTSLADTPAFVLLTDHMLLMRENEYKTESHDLSPVDGFSMDRAKAQAWADRFGSWFMVALFPFLLGMMYLFRMVQVLVYAGMASVIARIVKVRLHFDAMLRIAAVAMTPPLILGIILGSFGGGFSGLTILITLGYLYFALRANTE